MNVCGGLPQGAVVNVQLQRVPADAIRDRYHMFELFARLKVSRRSIALAGGPVPVSQLVPAPAGAGACTYVCESE